MKLYRSILFVPGNRPDWMDKAPKYGPDALILDLEDAVPIAEKAEARQTVRAGIERLRERGVPIVVRVNGVNTGLTGEDVEAIVTAGLVAVAVPKLERVEEVLKVDAWIELFERKAGLPLGTVEILALPEAGKRWLIAGALGVFHGLYFALFLRATGYSPVYVLAGAAFGELLLIAVFAFVFSRISRLLEGMRPVQVSAGLLLGIGMFWFFLRLKG